MNRESEAGAILGGAVLEGQPPPAAPLLGQEPIDDAPVQEGDLQIWSVTSILNVLSKAGIPYWSAEQAALAAIQQQATWRGMLEDDDPACEHLNAGACPVVKWLRDARDRKPKGYRSATQLGTDVHTAVEQYALTGTRPDVDLEVAPFVDQFDRWLDRTRPTYRAAEVTVYHPELGYAGTLDAILEIDGVRFIADYKTTRKDVDGRGKPTTPYPEEVALQLAAYRWARHAAVWRVRRHEKYRRRYYLLSEAERALAVPVPTVDTGLVIHITPDRCEAYPMACDEDVFEAYLAVQDAARWAFQDSKKVMGAPLIATGVK